MFLRRVGISLSICLFALSGACSSTNTGGGNGDPDPSSGGEHADPFEEDEIPERPDGPLEEDEIPVLLESHNSIRAELDLEPLEWSEFLANTASTWVTQCIDADEDLVIDHNPELQARALGENIWTGTGRRAIDDAVEAWAAEVDFYDAEEDTCAEGQVCGHYTQLVWSDTREVGCGRAFCQDHRYQYVVVCNYDPPGNIQGERPY
jgi:hypothetical protein